MSRANPMPAQSREGDEPHFITNVSFSQGHITPYVSFALGHIHGGYVFFSKCLIGNRVVR